MEGWGHGEDVGTRGGTSESAARDSQPDQLTSARSAKTRQAQIWDGWGERVERADCKGKRSEGERGGRFTLL